MKSLLTIVCSLLLLWSQAVTAAAATTPAVAAHCGCGGKMACCQTTPAPHSVPLEATTAAVSHQILSPAPATFVWVLTAAAIPFLSPTVSPSLTAAHAPIFARICVRLI